MSLRNATNFITALLPYVPAAIAGVTAAADLLGWGADKIQQMVGEGRDPTPEEWAELNIRTAELRTALHTD